MSYDSNLDRLTVIDLRAIAADLKIAGRSKMKRAELVAAITEAEAVNAATAEHENEEIDLTSTIDDMISGWLPDEVAGQDDHATAVAMMYANIVAEDEARAAARRARNRTNYGPAAEADEQADADAEAGELLDAALGGYVEPTGSHGQIAITKYSANEAIATAAFDVDSIGGHVTRERGRWVLRYAAGTPVRAKTLNKVAKLWAKQLGFRVDTIDVEVMS